MSDNPEVQSNESEQEFGPLVVNKSSEPVFEGPDPSELGFSYLPIARLKQKGSISDEYHVYSGDEEFETVQARTVVDALSASSVESPVKVTHASCKICEVIKEGSLEFDKVVTSDEHIAGTVCISKNPENNGQDAAGQVENDGENQPAAEPKNG